MGSKLPLSETTKKDLARGSPALLPDSRCFPEHLMVWGEATAGGGLKFTSKQLHFVLNITEGELFLLALFLIKQMQNLLPGKKASTAAPTWQVLSEGVRATWGSR